MSEPRQHAPWQGPPPPEPSDWDTWQARREVAATKVCGWCNEPYEAWMDLSEWVCEFCVPEVRE